MSKVVIEVLRVTENGFIVGGSVNGKEVKEIEKTEEQIFRELFEVRKISGFIGDNLKVVNRTENTLSYTVMDITVDIDSETEKDVWDLYEQQIKVYSDEDMSLTDLMNRMVSTEKCIKSYKTEKGANNFKNANPYYIYI